MTRRADMIRLATLGLLALTAGCASATPPSERGRWLGPVDLSQPITAVGTEPFWTVELDGRHMTYRTPGKPDKITPQPAPVLSRDQAAYSAESEGMMVTVTLRVDPDCSDGMSDRIYPLAAVAVRGAWRVEGCAASTDALRNAPDSGSVQP